MTSVVDPGHESAIYAVSGELFFAFTSDLADQFLYAEDPEHVIIDLTAARICSPATSPLAIGADSTLPNMTGRLLQIGEVADEVGLSLRTVRYYEQMGLLVPERRSEGGFRLYGTVQVQPLRLIKSTAGVSHRSDARVTRGPRRTTRRRQRAV